MNCAKTAEPMDDGDGVWDLESCEPNEACIRLGCALAPSGETIEPSMCGGDAACCQIIFTTC